MRDPEARSRLAGSPAARPMSAARIGDPGERTDASEPREFRARSSEPWR